MATAMPRTYLKNTPLAILAHFNKGEGISSGYDEPAATKLLLKWA
jgi:hypothetical protein